jgi:amino acid transporter
VRGEHPTTVSESATENESVPAEPRLIRGAGLVGATTLNMIDMTGVGPFITIPRAVLLSIALVALGCIRIIVQFLAQIAGVFVLRARRPELPRPFRPWLYPLPAVLAFAGFVYVLLMRPNFQKEVRLAFVLIAAGLVVYLLRARVRGGWPFGGAETINDRGAEVQL